MHMLCIPHCIDQQRSQRHNFLSILQNIGHQLLWGTVTTYCSLIETLFRQLFGESSEVGCLKNGVPKVYKISNVFQSSIPIIHVGENGRQ